MQLFLLAGEYSVVRCDPNAEVPCWANCNSADAINDFITIARTREELSIVCRSELVDAEAAQKVEPGWRAFRVAGQLEFDQVGIVAGLAQPLAAAGIPLFCISTFDTDYLLVKEQHRANAQDAWSQAGHAVDASVA